MRFGWLRYSFLASVLCVGCGPGPAAPMDMAMQDMTSMVGCNDPVALRPDGGVCVRTVSGQVVDEAGAPLGDLVVSVCSGTCYLGKSAADGTFSVEVASHIRTDRFAVEVHGRPDHTSSYVRLPPLNGDTMTFAAPLLALRLPASGPTIKTDGSAQTVTAGDVTLQIAAGTNVTINVEDLLGGASGSQFRPLKVANPTQLSFIDATAVPDALYAFSPFEILFSVKTPLSFANTAGLPANAAVDIQAMGGLLGSLPPAGNFTTVALAHVSADGTTITMDPGEGVKSLTWMALKKK